MPLRPAPVRNQTWLLPPTVDDLIAADHPARFVAAFVEALDAADWGTLGIDPAGTALGAPAYHPQALLGVWLYGFMSGVRSARRLEAACRDQLPYRWLTGWQQPDHNTLWRFYQAHRQGLRQLLRRTVRTAVQAGLVDLAVQAIDGTKIQGNAARDRTYTPAGLQQVLTRTEQAIADLEAQNATGGEPPPPRLPKELAKAQALRAQIEQALQQVRAEEGHERINLTDPDTALVKSRQGIVAGYNAQAVVSPLDPAQAGRRGLLLTAAAVVTDPDDHAQLLPMLSAAEANTGRRAELSLADGGYHSGANLAGCEARQQPVAIPEEAAGPYAKDAFAYDAATDTYTCPLGQPLPFTHVKQRQDRPPKRVYRAAGAVCRACPAFGVCTKDRQGRAVEIGPYDAELRRHRTWMARDTVKTAYRQRQELIEPSFGILKEQQGARRFLLRGLEQVRAEWALLATAFNLRTLWRVWRHWVPGRRGRLLGAAGP